MLEKGKVLSPNPFRSSKYYIVVEGGKVKKINRNFLKLIKFDKKIVVGKKIEDFFDLIRLYPEYEDSFNDNTEYFLFNSRFEVRCVKITKFKLKKDDKYLLVFSEINKHTLKQRLNFFKQLEQYSDNILGVALFTVPDFVLLKANNSFFKYLYDSTSKRENMIGKKLHLRLKQKYQRIIG